MDYIAKAKRVLSLEIAELQRLHDRIGDSFSQALEILESNLTEQRKIIVAGIGKSGNIGNKLAATFNSTGAPAVVLNCQDALHGDLGLIDPGDAVIALSYSGETVELLNVIPHLKRRGAQIIAVTGQLDSTLARHADCVLDVAVEREACPLNLAPTSSTTNTLALGDALAMVLLEARGFRKENFAELHPGGSLGHTLLTRAKDIMRSGDELVCVPADQSIMEAIGKMTEARAGAVVVVDEQGLLEGIFSQGDFARAFQSSGSSEIGHRPVGDFMTIDPIAVSSEQLVGEALKLLEDNRIDDLIVVDKENRPVGVIDTQDLTRIKVL